MARRNHRPGRRPSPASRDKYLKQRARSVPTVWKPATGVPMANRKRSAVLPERRRSETGWAGPGGGMKVLRPEQPSARMLRDRVMEAEALLEQGCRSVGASQIASGA